MSGGTAFQRDASHSASCARRARRQCAEHLDPFFDLTSTCPSCSSFPSCPCPSSSPRCASCFSCSSCSCCSTIPVLLFAPMAFGRATCQLGALRAGRPSLGPVGRAGDRLAEQRADLPGRGAITDQPTPCAGLETVLRRRPDSGWLVRRCDERRLEPVDRQLNVRIVEAGGPRRVERAAGVRLPQYPIASSTAPGSFAPPCRAGGVVAAATASARRVSYPRAPAADRAVACPPDRCTTVLDPTGRNTAGGRNDRRQCAPTAARQEEGDQVGRESTQPGRRDRGAADATPGQQWQGGSQPFRDARPGSWPAS